MKKHFLFFLSVFTLFGDSTAQFNSPLSLSRRDSLNHEIGIWTDFEMGANSLTNAFINKLYFGGHIGNDLKEASTKRLKYENQFGYELRYGVYYSFQKDAIKPTCFFTARSRQHLDVTFPKDLHDIILYGNQPYEGQNMYLDNTRINYLSYQEFGFGVLKNIGKTKAQYGVSLSFVKGQSFNQTRIKKGEVYTAPFGDTIRVETEFASSFSDTNNRGLKAINGMGAAIDLFAKIPYITKGHKGKLFIQLSDIGLIYWNKKSLNYSQDSSYSFDGYHIDNLFHISDSSFKTVNADSLINKYVHHKQEKTSTSLPSVFYVYTQTNYGKFQLVKGFRYIFNSNYKGYYFLQGNYQFNDVIGVSLRGSYGGWSVFSAGLALNLNMNKGFSINIQAYNINSWLMPYISGGHSIFLSAVKNF